MASCFIVFWMHPETRRVLLHHARTGLCLRRHAGHSHRLGRHAGGDVAAEFLCRPRCSRHRLRARQQRAHHRRHAGWFLRLHSVRPDVQGDEPLHHQRAVRRLWRGHRRGHAERRRRDARDHRSTTQRCNSPSPIAWFLFPATDWPRRRLNTPCANWPSCSKAAASPSSTRFIRWPAACRDT